MHSLYIVVLLQEAPLLVCIFYPYHRPGIPVALSLLEGVAELLGPSTEAYSQV